MKKTFSRIIQWILMKLVWGFCSSLYWTYRCDAKNIEDFNKAVKLSPNGAFLFAVWHELAIPSVSAYTGMNCPKGLMIMTSRSKDGDFAAMIARNFGHTAIRGSSRKKNRDKGGKEALLEYIDKLGKGVSGAITVDGPKGPRRVCKPGVVIMAQQTGVPIIPGAGIPSWYYAFNSWDRFKIALPFSKLTMVVGEPIYVPKDATNEQITEYCQLVSDRLNELDKGLFK